MAPDAVAVVCDGVWLSYGELFARAARLGQYLRLAGAVPESVVALCLDRGAEMITAIVGCWLAGAAYLPLDPGYPAERLAYMVADSGARLVVTRGAAVVAGLAGPVVVDLADPVVAAELAALPSGPPPEQVTGGQLAYVIYTSGSTGTPKGVAVAHGALANMTVGLRPALGAGPGTAVLQFASFSFDASVLDVAVTLAAGGTLVIASAADRADPGRLAGLVRRVGVRAASVVPSLLAVLDPRAVPGLSRVLSGAELLTGAGGRSLGTGPAALVNTYGPTEATLMVTVTGPLVPQPGQLPADRVPGGQYPLFRAG